MRKQCISILLRVLALLATLGLLMLSYGLYREISVPPQQDYGSAIANRLAAREQLYVTNAKVFATLLYSLLFAQSVFWLSS